MQPCSPSSDGKARAIRELSRSLSHSPRNITSPSPPASDSNPTKHSGFGTEMSSFFNDPDVLMSTQHKIEDETNTLPRFRGIRSTAKKVNAWHMLQSEPPIPDTSMVNKEFNDFDHSISDDEAPSIEQARGLAHSNRNTPNKMSAHFNSLYDMTPLTNRSRKSLPAETGSLRRDAQIRRASRNEFESASPRPVSTRNSPAFPAIQERKRTSLAQLHEKMSADESSFMNQRPPTLTIDSRTNTRWGNRSRQTSLQLDGNIDETPRAKGRAAPTQNNTAQSFILPDLPNLTELVSGVFEDGTPVISKTASRSRFSAPPNGSRRPQHTPIEGVPIPAEEKAIFAALQQLQDKVTEMETERAEQEKKIEEQELELIELRAKTQAQNQLRSDSAQDSDSGKTSWKVEKTRLDATVQTLRTKLDRSDRKLAVFEIEKKRLVAERDNMAGQLSVAFQACEELKSEKSALISENDELRQEIDDLRAKLQRDQSLHREETFQLKQQFDRTANATEKKNATLQAELARIRTQNDEHTFQLSQKDVELRQARQEQAEYARLKADHELLQAQVAGLKARREQEVNRWAQRETSLKAQVEHRDETIRNFHDLTQEKTNEAMRLDNDHLRRELAELTVQHEQENDQWTKREEELKRKIQRREDAARRSMNVTREVLGFRDANDQRFDAVSKGKTSAGSSGQSFQREPSQHRQDTRTQIKHRVEQEVRDSRILYAASQKDRLQEEPYRASAKASRFTSRSVSAPISGDKNVHVEDGGESTTDLSLAPRATSYPARSTSAMAFQPPAVVDMTDLSFIDGNQIAELRRTLEAERAAARRRNSVTIDHQRDGDNTIRSQRQTREDTIRSIQSAKHGRRPSLVRKSSLKENTQRTQFEEDNTGNVSNVDEATKQSIIDASMLSNTSRRRRSVPTEMTSAFIVPDIKLNALKQASTSTHRLANKNHDNTNCTVCRREGITSAANELVVPKLVPVSSRVPDDVDATLRPARPPKEALALVVKELQDERTHLHMELAVMRAMLESHDVSLGNRKRQEINISIQELLRRIEIKDAQIYNLYDVLEGQQTDDLTELDVENITQQIRAEGSQPEPERKVKKVTIRSFVDEDDDNIEDGRGVNAGMEDGETQELPWEGFEESELEADASFGAFQRWKASVH